MTQCGYPHTGPLRAGNHLEIRIDMQTIKTPIVRDCISKKACNADNVHGRVTRSAASNCISECMAARAYDCAMRLLHSPRTTRR
ncbi:hypothetical protein EVAR_51586_1 [Eumeta japonica]|uniref:Uncharacterized protein n=1 Tax=Eumeta variegata TaxID=151549 RepID=A0A4C1YE54_EUMVA|nr:hypothetical protein EVAR_51586_1 [Eumeta japonica]